MLDNQTIVSFQEKIRKRREVHRRDLPWRNTKDPYAIRISESMLCQTQVSRVIDYYEKRLHTFPTVQDLANASNEEVLRLWSGLGYNSRALRLKEAAKIIYHSPLWIQNYWNNYNNLIELPGVWDYIANAVLAFTYNQDVIVVDTNIRRIMIHEFGEKLWKVEKDEERWVKSLIRETLPKWKARDRYNALMDYGALELTARKSGIAPLTKQSKFSWSSRQVRAWIIRKILESTAWFITRNTVEKLYPDRDDLDQIISKMVQEKLIQENQYGFSIA